MLYNFKKFTCEIACSMVDKVKAMLCILMCVVCMNAVCMQAFIDEANQVLAGHEKYNMVNLLRKCRRDNGGQALTDENATRKLLKAVFLPAARNRVGFTKVEVDMLDDMRNSFLQHVEYHFPGTVVQGKTRFLDADFGTVFNAFVASKKFGFLDGGNGPTVVTSDTENRDTGGYKAASWKSAFSSVRRRSTGKDTPVREVNRVVFFFNPVKCITYRKAVNAAVRVGMAKTTQAAMEEAMMATMHAWKVTANAAVVADTVVKAVTAAIQMNTQIAKEAAMRAVMESHFCGGTFYPDVD
ncbi:hypothetical protein FACS1894122_02540 [Alphaproteobacteria bacterium]|nr:hypothetical protein FACS1894122_02540 [Alphaproteobacteria bacterium]